MAKKLRLYVAGLEVEYYVAAVGGGGCFSIMVLYIIILHFSIILPF